MNNLIKIGIVGAAGRMGKEIIKSVLSEKKLILTAAFEKENSGFIGIDVGDLIGKKKINVKIYEIFFIKKTNFDILIDFSSSDCLSDYLYFCKKYRKSIVIGTTNLNDTSIIQIKKAAKIIPIVLSENFSIGISSILNYLNYVTKIIGKLSDIEIIECHNKYKKDIPSGTAVAISKVIAKSIDLNLEKYFLNNKEKKENKMRINNISFSCIRAKDVISEHSIIFFMKGERVEITHKIFNRNIYAQGVIKSCLWLRKKKYGLFNMLNVLGLIK